jgi:hypothetical protein
MLYIYPSLAIPISYSWVYYRVPIMPEFFEVICEDYVAVAPEWNFKFMGII